MFARTGISSGFRVATRMIGASPRAKRPRSRKLVSPRARMFTASPVTIWSAPKRTVAMATMSATKAPPRTLATSPQPRLPRTWLAITPAKAPASIMPSSPTAKTPARSERMPPRAAKSSGVAMRRLAARNSITSSGPPGRRGQGDRGQHEHHGESLDHQDERRGHPDRALHREGARLQEGEKQPGGQHAEWIQAADERDGEDRKSTRLNSSHVEISYAV